MNQQAKLARSSKMTQIFTASTRSMVSRFKRKRTIETSLVVLILTGYKMAVLATPTFAERSREELLKRPKLASSTRRANMNKSCFSKRPRKTKFCKRS